MDITGSYIKNEIGQQKDAGEKAIDNVFMLWEDVSEWKKRLALLVLNQASSDDSEEITAVEAALNTASKRLLKAERVLGQSSKAKLERLRGNRFVSLTVQAHALKLRIQSKIINYKCEQGKLKKGF
ncbi:MAG TPA: hypothetical protein VGO47_06200 [Chlamydiales bacterium]|nr:hypothetical protein [Chlamydiales bacterium]